MAKEIVMPQMGAEMEEGALVRWTKQPGDLISRGEAIGEIETDKATVDLESFDEGFFLGGIIEPGLMVPVGTVIGWLGAQGEALPEGAAPPAPATAPAGQPSAAAPAQTETAQPAAASETAASPAPAPPATARPAATADGASPAAQPRPSSAAMPSQSDNGAAPPEGQPLAGATGAEPPPAQPAAALASPPNGRQMAPSTAPSETASVGVRPRVSPVARGIAEELGIDLGQVHGSGPDGRIMRQDVEAFARQQAEAPAAPPAERPAAPAETSRPAQAPATTTAATAAPAEAPAPPAAAAQPVAALAEQLPEGEPVPAGGIEPLSRMRQTIARRMAAAKREIPHYYLTLSVDMTEAAALRRQVNASLEEAERISVNDMLIKACALALERFPRFNAAFTDQGLRLSESINIGIAVALPDGLIVPAVLNCQGKSLGAIARGAHDVTERARGGRLKQAELADGTFTISNLGMYGVETLIAIIQPGQSGILGVGKMEPRPVVRDGEIVIREMMTIAISADHRVTDGAQGAQFLATIRDLLQQPMRLIL